MRKLIFVLSILVLAIPCSADVITVPGDYPTIQAAIDAASVGDMVSVAEGTYNENVSSASEITIHFTQTSTINGQVTTGIGTNIIADAGLTINSDSDITLGGTVTVGGILGLYADGEIVINNTIEALEIEMIAGSNIYLNGSIHASEILMKTDSNINVGGSINGTGSVEISAGSNITGNTDLITGGSVVIATGGNVMPLIVAGTIYVDKDATGSGDGSSWEDAFIDLQSALDAAWPGNEIRVAEGTYFPTYDYGLGLGDRSKHFRMRNHIAIYGGFSGYGTADPNDRDVEVYETILSGDIGTTDDPNDNCYHVFYHPDGLALDPNAILDGFTITAGNASGLEPHNRGGGMFNASGNLQVTNCTFSGNVAGHIDSFLIEVSGQGGGMYNYDSSPRITNCHFISNRAFESGGGVYNDSDSNPILTACTFTENSASYFEVVNIGLYVHTIRAEGSGGGICNTGSNPIVTNCTFSANEALLDGGGISNANSSPEVIDCAFGGNIVTGLPDGDSWDGGPLQISGGGMSNYESRPTVTNCSFIDNKAGNGAGMYNDSNSCPVVTDCAFSENRASYVATFTIGPSMIQTVIEGGGGGIYNTDSDPIVTNCAFTGNSVLIDGGGMSNFSSNPIVTNCTFAGNLAKGYTFKYPTPYFDWSFHIPGVGGAINNDDSEPVFTNCTFAANRAPNGNAISCASSDNWQSSLPSNVRLVNCILWDGGDEIFNDDSSTITITYSDIDGGWPGEGNIDTDPYFVDPGYWDPNNTPSDPNDDFWVDGNYRLQPDSPCIDVGDNSVVDANYPDLDGNERIINGIVDMGAYEALLPIEADVHIIPRVINRQSRMKRVIAIMRLPEGVSKHDVADEPFEMYVDEVDGEPIEAIWQRVIGWRRRASVFALFDKAELMDAVEHNGRVELTVVGRLESGQYIYGSDTVRIIEPQRRRGRRRGRYRRR